MTCPMCFFRDSYQLNLKRKSFGINRFEIKLRAYKKNFLAGVSRLQTLQKCDCATIYGDAKLACWVNSFRQTLIDNIDEISDSFDDLIAVYDAFVKYNQKIASDLLWEYVESHGLSYRPDPWISNTRLLFRARKKGEFDHADIGEYFHIPFTMRHLVANQRFSVSGQPMLYFGSSVLGVSKELGLDMEEMLVAAFMPFYSSFYGRKIFSLRNKTNDTLENALPGLFNIGSNPSFDGLESFPASIREIVLMQICTFPKEKGGTFVAEYAIPQMLTTILLSHGFHGLAFPSTKDFGDLVGRHRFSQHHVNVALFVPYDSEHSLSDSLLRDFYTITPCQKMGPSISVSSVINLANEIIEQHKASTARTNNNDYIIPIAMMNLHIEYLEKASIKNAPYFETAYGKTELRLFVEMLRHARTRIKL